VLTVEALASNGELSEVQDAMACAGGSQCGYCTPGFIVSMFAEYHRHDRRAADIESLAGNLCRCTGYRPIRDALLSLVGQALPPANRAQRGAPLPFRYSTSFGSFSCPETLRECLDILDGDPEARLVAGNTDLGVMTNLQGQRFPHLVSVENLTELRRFREDAEAIEIGSGLTLSEIGEQWTNAPPVFHEWLKLFGSPLIRNRATLGGNLATASPIGDSAPLLLAWDAELTIASRAGVRTVPLAKFFSGYRRTVLERGELIVSVRIPKSLPDQTRFYKIAKRRTDDISTVAAGLSLWRDGGGRIAAARLAFGGVAPVPLRAIQAEGALAGTMGEAGDFVSARRMIAGAISPITDHRGSAPYRSALAENLLEKFRYELSSGEVAA
jgi:xanthine dehydrogenase small subunit